MEAHGTLSESEMYGTCFFWAYSTRTGTVVGESIFDPKTSHLLRKSTHSNLLSILKTIKLLWNHFLVGQESSELLPHFMVVVVQELGQLFHGERGFDPLVPNLLRSLAVGHGRDGGVHGHGDGHSAQGGTEKSGGGSQQHLQL